MQEQVIQLIHADDVNDPRVGKLVGAQAVIVGEVQQWEQGKQERTNSVSLALRMIDVKTGVLLFNGQGHLADPTNENLESSVRLIIPSDPHPVRLADRTIGIRTDRGSLGIAVKSEGDDSMW